MRSLFEMGIQHPSRTYLGQIESIISAAINAGVAVYRIRSEEERAEEALEFKEEQASYARAREEEALRIQQEAIKALQDQSKPKTTTTTPGAPESTILGMKPTTFYIAAGLTAGALVLGTILLTKGK